MSNNEFISLGLSEPMVRRLSGLGIDNPFPIQSMAIGPALSGRDLQGKAPTGSGKTLAFGLPLLSMVGRAERGRPRALVLAPTRELAEQIRGDLAPLAETVGRRVTAIYGGVGYGPQLKSLRSGVDILVATPGRLEDLMERRAVELTDVDIVVVDEADRMADMGFLPAVRRILDRTSPRRQTYMFSATLDGDVAVLGRRYQNDPAVIEIDAVGESFIEVAHHFWRVAQSDRPYETARVIAGSGRSIVFTRTRHGADRLVKQLASHDIAAVAMHGGRSQSQRTRALRAFSSGQVPALIATDVAARGIHVEDVDTVIHYDLAGGHKDYLHRSGRTARAGDTGTVVSLVMDGQEHEARRIQRTLGIHAPIKSPDLEGLTRPPGAAPSQPTRQQPAPQRETRAGSVTTRPGRGLYVGNLSWDTTEAELAALFARHGKVERASISTRNRDGRSKGFGFVEMPTHHQQRAITALDGAILDGRALRVRPAR